MDRRNGAGVVTISRCRLPGRCKDITMHPSRAPSDMLSKGSGQHTRALRRLSIIVPGIGEVLGWAVAALLVAGCQAGHYSEACPAYSFSQCIGLTPGSANTQFKGNGVAAQGNTTGTNSADSANAIAFDASGRVVVTGISTNSVPLTNLVVWRFNPDGTPDAAFGPGGFVTHAGTVAGDGDRAQAAVIDGQGNIAVAGFSTPMRLMACPVPPPPCAPTPLSMVLWRYTPAGGLDSAFNASGIAANNTAPVAGSEDATGLVLDSLGNLVAVGEGFTFQSSGPMAVWRYTPDGVPDPAFNGGTAYASNLGASTYDGASQGVLDAAGHLLVTGFSTPTATAAAVWELDPALTPPLVDSVVPPSAAGGTDDTGMAIALDASGRVLVAGFSVDASATPLPHMALWRFTRHPLALDKTFGGGLGYVTTLNSIAGDIGEQGNAVLVDFAGRIVVAGFSQTTAAGTYMTVWRFYEDGTPDLNFGGQGFVVQTSTAYPGQVSFDQANGLTMDATGHLYVAGSSALSTGASYMAVWSFNP